MFAGQNFGRGEPVGYYYSIVLYRELDPDFSIGVYGDEIMAFSSLFPAKFNAMLYINELRIRPSLGYSA